MYRVKWEVVIEVPGDGHVRVIITSKTDGELLHTSTEPSYNHAIEQVRQYFEEEKE